MSNLKYWLWLTGRKGLAGQNSVRVLNYFGSPERVYFSDSEEYLMIEGLSEAALHSLADKSLDTANKILGDCDRLGIRLLTMQDAAYPERLAAIHQTPMVLYTKGSQVAFDEGAAIAIVGTLLLFEACRRVVGLPIVCVSTLFIVYAFFVVTRSPLRIIMYKLFYTTEGIAGTPLNVCATFIVLFIIFASFLEQSGIGAFFVDLEIGRASCRERV